jgi:hypothetical protein
MRIKQPWEYFDPSEIFVSKKTEVVDLWAHLATDVTAFDRLDDFQITIGNKKTK